jgi:hypothetical protein
MRIHSPQITGSAANTNIVLTTVTASISVLSSSFAATASSADDFIVRGTLTAQTINVQTITSSIEFNTGSTRNGSLLSNTHEFTGSVLMTGSLLVNNSNVILTNQTSSMSVASASYWSGSIINAATASYVLQAQSASYWSGSITNAATASYVVQAQSASYWSGSIINAATASYVLQAQSASYWSGSITNAATASYVLNAVSASYALTASYISGSGGGVGFPFSGSAIITGSLFVSGSTISGSFKGDGSQITGLTAGGKIHTQTSAASTWTVTHNLGVQYPNVTVYDNNNNVIIPQTIVATDANTLTLTFGSAVAGYAVAGIGGIINVQGRTTQQYFTASTTWSFAHNLGDKYVSLQAFDDAFEMMIPTTIRLVDFTSSLMLFDSASSGYAVATIGGDLPAISSSYAGYTLQVANSAPYSASWVAAANVAVTTAVSSSFAATASSADNLTVRGTLTAQTINVQTITSSIDFVTGSAKFGSLLTNTHQFTGSVGITGSNAVLLNINNGVLYVSASGNVGIGTSSPSDLLELKSTSASNPNLRFYSTYNSGASAYGINWYRDYDSSTNAIAGYIRYNRGGGSDGDMLFGTGTNSGVSERMRITSTGNVGIGTSSPNTSYGVTIQNPTSFSSNALRLERNGVPAQGLNISAGGEVVTFNGFNTASDGLNSAFVWTSTAFNTTTERMRITSGGNVLIGGTSTLGASGTNLEISGGRAQLVVNSTTATASWFSVYPAGDGNTYILRNTGYSFLFGTATNQATAGFSQQMSISSNGSIGAPSGTNIYNASDARLKKNISKTTYGLNTISALNPVKFNWVDGFEPSEDGKDMLGFVAQEVQTVIPEAVESFGSNVDLNGTTIENTLRVNEKFIIPVLVKAIQELSAKVTALENK